SLRSRTRSSCSGSPSRSSSTGTTTSMPESTIVLKSSSSRLPSATSCVTHSSGCSAAMNLLELGERGLVGLGRDRQLVIGLKRGQRRASAATELAVARARVVAEVSQPRLHARDQALIGCAGQRIEVAEPQGQDPPEQLELD